MFERFTDRARRVIVLAQEESRMMHHPYIGTEHILLGLIDERQGVAARVLNDLGVALESARSAIREMVPPGEAPTPDQVPFTKRAKKTLELALREALYLGHNYIGTEHILLGLMREDESSGARVLRHFDVDLVEARGAVKALLANSISAPPPPGSAGGPLIDLIATVRSPEQGWYPRTQARVVRKIASILSRRDRNSAVLIAENRVDSNSMAMALADMIAKGEVPREVSARGLYQLMPHSLISQSQGELLHAIETARTSGGLVLHVPDFVHLFTSQDGVLKELAKSLREGLMDGSVQVVTAMTEEDYREYVRGDAIGRRFESMPMDEASVDDAVGYIKSQRDQYEAHNHVSISDNAVLVAAILGEQFMGDLDLLDAVAGLIDSACAIVDFRRSGMPRDLRDLEARISDLREQKERAIQDQDFSQAAAYRDEERAMIASRKEAEERWRRGDSGIANAVVDEQIIIELVAERTGIAQRRLQVAMERHMGLARGEWKTGVDAYRILNDQPVPAGTSDLLGSGDIATRLAAILSTSRASAPFVLAIDGNWGVGKSTLLRQIQEHVRDERTVTVEYNAWTASGANSLESLVKSVLVKMDPFLLRRWTRELARKGHVSLIVRIFSAILGNFFGVGRMVDNLWDQAGVNPELRNELRQTIGGLLEDWVEADAKGGQANRAMVVFVDDLDRCSDLSVVGVCEAMKLYLDVPGLVFVIACDMSRVAEAVASGVAAESQIGRAYLEKIVQVTYRVPPPSMETTRQLIRGYAEESATSQLVDENIMEVLAEHTLRNPRRIKRIINSFVLETNLNPRWHDAPLDHSHVFTSTLVQHIYPTFYDVLVNDASGEDPIGDFLDYAAVKKLASDTPEVDDRWWSIAGRLFRGRGLAPPRRAAGINVTIDLASVEEALPASYPALANNERFVSLLRGVGNSNTRRALRRQLLSHPLSSAAPDRSSDVLGAADTEASVTVAAEDSVGASNS
ncbi:P-loop NTPase fold protein [Agromyces binzhouensis]|uniref:AAA family ATPase n=1 Tax=Agromyces binzhouensis TaxID=1817495 RepID=A0A4V1QTG5_9MICO|nr:P-loop NTPase fold protein [Agromyces binzhouensis]RXZ51813.1 hypothetical protein ESO86_00665 [Agromyces binzhouensis]